jgi:hypothetical protein
MWALVALLVATTSAFGRQKSSGEPFKYVGGTESPKETCEGNLQLGQAEMTFRCPTGSISIPYTSISLMQYRPDISRKVVKMKLKWALRPPVESAIIASKKNRYFTVLYDEQGATHAVILDVTPQAMRPYLAEIDLKTGKRVEVKSYEGYD